MTEGAPARLPAAARRAEILAAAEIEFAARGLAGARLEAIAARVGVTHPRIVQMFGSKRKLFLDVVDAAYGRIAAAFAGAAPTLAGLGTAYWRLLHTEPTVGLIMLQSFAASGDDTVRAAVRRRQLELQDSIAHLTGADDLRIRAFVATGLSTTVSTVLDLPQQHTDLAWSTWILGLTGQEDPPPGRPEP